MTSFILCIHEADKAHADAIASAFRRAGHQVTLDQHPITDPLWDGGWTALCPGAEVVLVLLTERFAQALSGAPPGANHNSLDNRVAQHKHSMTILPLVTDKASLPESLVGFPALFLPALKPDVLTELVLGYTSQLSLLTTRKFVRHMRYVSAALLLASMTLFLAMQFDRLVFFQDIIAPLFMTSLGALSASSHLLFNLTGYLVEDDFNIGRVDENYLRILLGGIVGWLSYVILLKSSYAQSEQFLAIAMVATFLSGFSSRLVIAVINQALAAVERGLQLNSNHQTTPTDKGAQ